MSLPDNKLKYIAFYILTHINFSASLFSSNYHYTFHHLMLYLISFILCHVKVQYEKQKWLIILFYKKYILNCDYKLLQYYYNYNCYEFCLEICKYVQYIPMMVKAREGSGVIFACLAYFKVLFMLEQPLLIELKNLETLRSYCFFKTRRSQPLLCNNKGRNWPKWLFIQMPYV